MNDLTFFTNEEGKTLSDRFKKIINNNNLEIRKNYGVDKYNK